MGITCEFCREQPAAHTHRHGKLTMAVCTSCDDRLRRADAARELQWQRAETGRAHLPLRRRW